MYRKEALLNILVALLVSAFVAGSIVLYKLVLYPWWFWNIYSR